MSLDDLQDELSRSHSFWFNLPPAVRAASVFAIPFIVVDAFNYFSAGVAQALSWPVLALLYAGCGGLAAKFAAERGRRDYAYNGAIAGFALWIASLLVNGIIALIAGVASLGATLLLGIPYVCLCGPIQLIVGGLLGALGGAIYSWTDRQDVTDNWQ